MKTITLTAPHEHDGREHPAGTELTLDDTAADWLIEIGKARVGSTRAKADAMSKATEFTQDKEQACY